MQTRGAGQTADDLRDDGDLTLELQRARFDAEAAARTLIRVCADASASLVALDESTQRMRRASGRLHEAVSAFLITRNT